MRKKYKTINDIPHDKLDTVVELLKRGDKQSADTLLKSILSLVKDKPYFEVWHLAHGLMKKANT